MRPPVTSTAGNASLQTFAIDPSSGAISYISTDMPMEGRDWGQQFGSFSGNGAYLYGTNLTIFTNNILVASQSADGSLSKSPIFPALHGLPYTAANSMVIGTDPTTHLAAAVQASDADGNATGPIQLASFTINSDGNLSTTNSNAQMPQAPSLNGAASPDGTLIAMFGDNGGIQVYNFNGADPITALGGTLATDSISQLSWDRQNHLYALSKSQMLYVFNLTSAGATPAPGSPHSISNAYSFTLQP